MVSHVQERYEFGPFRLDPAEHTLLRGDQVVALTPKAFETLAFLVRSGGHLVRKEELIERVWRDTIVEEGNLNVIIHTLRKALGDDPREHKYIETVAKCGYRFVAQVRKAGADQDAPRETIGASTINGVKQLGRLRTGTDRRDLASTSASPSIPRLLAKSASPNDPCGKRSVSRPGCRGSFDVAFLTTSQRLPGLRPLLRA